jgi:hypothetical protein
MWQSDVMEAFYISDRDGSSKLVYLIGFIDDHSRRVLHCQFYFDATLTCLEDCLKDEKCFPLIHSLTSGAPRRINQLCYASLLEAYKANQSIISEEIIKKVQAKLAYV